MAKLRFEDLQDGLTLKDMKKECFILEFFLTKEESVKLKSMFKQYHGENPNYDKMPWWKFIYENVEVKLK